MNQGPILLVEDNPDDVALTIRAFQKGNISNEILVAEDGAAALALLLPEDGSDGLRPAIVLLDLHLPLIGGLEVLRRLREDHRSRSLPVVILTTSSEEQDIVTAYDNGANSYVSKPVDFDEFVEAVRTLGLYWLLLNQTPPPAR